MQWPTTQHAKDPQLPSNDASVVPGPAHIDREGRRSVGGSSIDNRDEEATFPTWDRPGPADRTELQAAPSKRKEPQEEMGDLRTYVAYQCWRLFGLKASADIECMWQAHARFDSRSLLLLLQQWTQIAMIVTF